MDFLLNNLKWSDILVFIVICIVVFGLCLIIFCFVIFIKYWNMLIVKVLNKEFSFILLFVVVLFFVFVLLNLFIFIDILCRVVCIWCDIVYILCVFIFFLKLRKIVKVFWFQGKLFDSLVFRINRWKNFCFKGQRFYLFLLLFIQIILNLIWILVDLFFKEIIVCFF